MSRTVEKNTRSRPFDLRIIFTYALARFSDILTKNDSGITLKVAIPDILALELPAPSTQRMEVITDCCFEYGWFDETNDLGSLCMLLVKKIGHPDHWDSHNRKMRDLGIVQVELYGPFDLYRCTKTAERPPENLALPLTLIDNLQKRKRHDSDHSEVLVKRPRLEQARPLSYEEERRSRQQAEHEARYMAAALTEQVTINVQLGEKLRSSWQERERMRAENRAIAAILRKTEVALGSKGGFGNSIKGESVDLERIAADAALERLEADETTEKLAAYEHLQLRHKVIILEDRLKTLKGQKDQQTGSSEEKEAESQEDSDMEQENSLEFEPC
ncbi:hypothetical protein VKT23_011023 [Stygiomarasmius scandens]|uniref:Uncharacterized protein n=1 Tax=Marasmiellus scandens TaxID=2682957 RepID=A0ABR1JC64_9AGAR